MTGVDVSEPEKAARQPEDPRELAVTNLLKQYTRTGIYWSTGFGASVADILAAADAVDPLRQLTVSPVDVAAARQLADPRIEPAAKAVYEDDFEGMFWADLDDAFPKDALTRVRYESLVRSVLAAADVACRCCNERS